MVRNHLFELSFLHRLLIMLHGFCLEWVKIKQWSNVDSSLMPDKDLFYLSIYLISITLYFWQFAERNNDIWYQSGCVFVAWTSMEQWTAYGILTYFALNLKPKQIQYVLIYVYTVWQNILPISWNFPSVDPDESHCLFALSHLAVLDDVEHSAMCFAVCTNVLWCCMNENQLIM